MNQVRHKDRRLYNKLKRYWKRFLMKETELDYTRYERYPLFDALTNTGNMVDYLLNQHEVFNDTYRMAQEL